MAGAMGKKRAKLSHGSTTDAGGNDPNENGKFQKMNERSFNASTNPYKQGGPPKRHGNTGGRDAKAI